MSRSGTYFYFLIILAVDIAAADHTMAQSDWPKFRGDLLNTGFSTSIGDWIANAGNKNYRIASDEVVWYYQMRAKIVCSPAIANDALYIGGGDGVMYCFK